MRRRIERAAAALIALAFVSAAPLACGEIAGDPDGGDAAEDATLADVAEAEAEAEADATLDVLAPDAQTVLDSTVDDVLDAAAEADADADADVAETGLDASFDGIPDASGCTYYSDASCTTLPKPISIPVGCVATPPTPQGGAIAPGVYHLTQVDWNEQYFDGGCPTNTTRGGSMEICGNVIEHYDVNEVKSVFVGNLVFQTIGNMLDLEQYCPYGPYYALFGYTATSTQLTINWGNPVAVIETFTKQ